MEGSGEGGVPLSPKPQMGYEEKQTILESGEVILFYSDGLVEAHDPQQRDVWLPQT
jgi:serine phosphatase RsbU (regulator of sigma subunit)